MRRRRTRHFYGERTTNWSSDEIWRGLNLHERNRVRNQRQILNLREPNWRPPRNG